MEEKKVPRCTQCGRALMTGEKKFGRCTDCWNEEQKYRRLVPLRSLSVRCVSAPNGNEGEGSLSRRCE